MRNLTIAGLFPAVVLIVAGPWLFKFVFGADWQMAGQFAQIMAVPMLLRFVGGPLFRCLTILKAQKWILVWDGLGCVTMLMLLSAIANMGSTGLDGVKGIAVSISLTYAGLLAAATYVVFRHAASPRKVPAQERAECPAPK